MTDALILAVNFRAIGLTIAVVVLAGFVLLFIRTSFQAKAELGSELELAPNKKEYLPDEELEGKKLDWSLSFALVVLVIVALSLPFYWLAEPGRQEGAVDVWQQTFERRGEGVYLRTAQCVNCHAAGGAGGSAPYVLRDQDGQFLANTTWLAPALNDLFLRYSEEEVTFILNFGRPGSPMAAWGLPGGGPLTSQQVQTTIEYLQTLEVPTLDPIEIDESDDPVAAREAADRQSAKITAEVERSLADGEFATLGEAVFNLGYYSGFSAGSLSCARCHTGGWSLGPSAPQIDGDPLSVGRAGCGGGDPTGIGFSLCGGDVLRRFPDDSWKLPDGSWAPEGGLVDDQGFFYYMAMDNSRIRLDDKGTPVTSRADDSGNPVPYRILADGNLADCRAISSLWEPESGSPYPFAAGFEVQLDDAGGFVAPPEIGESDLSGTVLRFADGRLGGDCTVVEMPERTSYAQYNFIFNGAERGRGYGRGGQSSEGMMPGFGSVLPPEYIQAVVDYERGL